MYSGGCTAVLYRTDRQTEAKGQHKSKLTFARAEHTSKSHKLEKIGKGKQSMTSSS